MATKTYTLSKTKVREMIEEKFGTDRDVEVKLGDVIALFEGRTNASAGSTLVKDADGNVIGKRCSYFGKFMPISEFGKRGENYAYQCKTAEAIGRKLRAEAIKAKDALDERLANEEISIAEWKEGLAEIEEMKNQKQELPENVIAFDTAEELLAALSEDAE